MTLRISSISPRPLARATTMPPPLARDMNISETMPLMVPTMDTAAMAASPTEDTRAVESMPMEKIKKESSASVQNMDFSSG